MVAEAVRLWLKKGKPVVRVAILDSCSALMAAKQAKPKVVFFSNRRGQAPGGNPQWDWVSVGPNGHPGPLRVYRLLL